MNDLLDWLLDLQGTVEVLDVSIRFSYPIPGWLLIFLFIGIGALAWRTYSHEASDRPLAERGAMSGLRTASWIVVIMLVLQPRLDIERLMEPRSNIVVLVDESQSMALRDQNDAVYQEEVATLLKKDAAWADRARRTEIIQQLLRDDSLDLLQRLHDQHAVHGYRFGDDLLELALPTKPGEKVALAAPTAATTQLGSALREVPQRLRGLPLAAVVVFSDGASNKGEEPLLAAQALAERRIPVFPVGIGSPHAVDVVVTDIQVQDLLFIDDQAALQVQVQATGMQHRQTTVEVRLGGELIGQQQVRLVDGEQTVDIAITPKRTGDLPLSVSIPPEPDEVVTDNNQRQRRVRVIDDAIRVLLAMDTPSWEMRYLMGTLLGDKRVDASVFIRRGDTRRAAKDPMFLERFPEPEELRQQYDCVVLCNLDANRLDPMHLEAMRDFVVEEGGGLIMTAATRGTPATFVNTAIGDMLPVVVDAIAEDPALDLADTFKRGFPLRLARDGALHPTTRLQALPEENARLWTELPPQYWYYTGIRRAKPSASVLVEHGKARNASGAIPLLATHGVGRGQVLFLGFNSWRWRYRIGDTLFDRFWGQTIQYMGLPHLLGSMNQVNFLTERRDFTVGDSIPVRVRVLDQQFQPVQRSLIELVANSEGGATQRFELAAADDRPGLFAGHIALPEGTWRLHVVGKEDDAHLTIDSLPPRWEFRETAMQAERLQQVAEITGGQFVALSELETLPELISATTRRTQSRLEIDLWDTWLAILLLACFTGSEWYLRRRIDLP